VNHLTAHSSYRVFSHPGITWLFLSFCFVTTLAGQTSSGSRSAQATSGTDAQHMADIENRLDVVTDALEKTQETLQKSMLEIQTLRAQLDALRSKTHATANAGGAPPSSPLGNAEVNTPVVLASNDAPKDDLQALHEQVDAMQEEIKQHEQIKVESSSKYPVRLTGLILFNAFSNAGVVDNTELPTLALPRQPGYSHGSTGATMSQTLVGLEATGPTFAGARSSAAVSMDFFGGATTNDYGYSTTSGVVRMRQSQIALDWRNTTLQAAYTGPLISPLSPTSYATVAEPGFAASGNLWTWSPQVRLEQRFPLSEGNSIGLEAGLLYPQSPSYTSGLDSPVESSRHPGYEGRVSYRGDESATGAGHHLALGIGGYSASQYYNSSTQIHSWAVTADWLVPLFKWFELSGEFYRGNALGGLGGGLYKDTLSGTNAMTGLPQTNGVETVGGWSQWKVRFSPTLEANAGFGIDDAMTSSFDGLVLMPGGNSLQQYARNNSFLGNFIYRPRTYLIFSPEYRHLETWPYDGPANVANIFTLSVGYQF
jgi:hypothetical protein